MKERGKRLICVLLAVIMLVTSVNLADLRVNAGKKQFTVGKNVYVIAKKPTKDTPGEAVLIYWGKSGAKAKVKSVVTYKQSDYVLKGICAKYKGQSKKKRYPKRQVPFT